MPYELQNGVGQLTIDYSKVNEQKVLMRKQWLPSQTLFLVAISFMDKINKCKLPPIYCDFLNKHDVETVELLKFRYKIKYCRACTS